MLLRRLLWNAEWFTQEYRLDIVELPKFLENRYLREAFNIQDLSQRKHLSRLITNAYDASQSKISPSLHENLKARAEKINQKCELRGCSIDYQKTNDEIDSFSLDHIWPRTLGGESQEYNLQTTCKRCNSLKQNIGNYSDIHYEHFHVKRNQTEDKQSSYWREFNNQFRIGVLMRAGFQCEVCGEHVSRMNNGLSFIPKNKSENINIFNVIVTCDRHAK